MSKVKSHSRRSKDGKQVRVKESRRKSIGKKLAIAGGSLAAYTLYKGGKKLQGAVAKQKSLRDFKPKAEGPITKNIIEDLAGNGTYEDRPQSLLENSREVKVNSIRKSIANARWELHKVRENQAKTKRRT